MALSRARPPIRVLTPPAITGTVKGILILGTPVVRPSGRRSGARVRRRVRVSSGTPPRTINFPWGDGSRVAVRFESRGPAKSQVAIQQDPLSDAAAVEELRAWWRSRLTALKQHLESAGR